MGVDDDITSVVLSNGIIMDAGDDVIDTDDEVKTDVDMLLNADDVHVDDNIISVILDDDTIMSDVIVDTDDDVIIGVDDITSSLVDNTRVDVDNVMTAVITVVNI